MSIIFFILIIHSIFITRPSTLSHTLIHFCFRICVELIRLCGDHDSYKLKELNIRKKKESRKSTARARFESDFSPSFEPWHVGVFVCAEYGLRTFVSTEVIYVNLFHNFTTLSLMGENCVAIRARASSNVACTLYTSWGIGKPYYLFFIFRFHIRLFFVRIEMCDCVLCILRGAR